MFDFEQLNKIDEGTYGVVFRARDKRSGKIYALKKVKMEKEREGFPQTALREANILLSMHHPNVCLLYTSPSPRDLSTSRMPSSA